MANTVIDNVLAEKTEEIEYCRYESKKKAYSFQILYAAQQIDSYGRMRNTYNILVHCDMKAVQNFKNYILKMLQYKAYSSVKSVT